MTAGASANTGRRRGRRTLAGRVLVASAILAVLVVAAFAVLVIAISTLRDATEREARAKDITAATLRLESVVLGLETGLRGLVISGEERFLQPWERARGELPEALSELRQLTADDPRLSARARVIDRTVRRYVTEYSLPLVEIAREAPGAAGTPLAVADGRARVEQIRKLIRNFRATEDARATRSAEAAERRSDRAIQLGIGGLVASGLLIVLFGAYLARSIARPVRDVAESAARLAEGDLSIRLGERGLGEVGELRRSFNAMAERLEASSRELHEQNEQLRESERIKSELVGIVSHEVRTPLASVLGFTSLLLSREFDDETRLRYLEIVDTQARRLASLLDDFLDLQRVEEGRLQLVEELLDMRNLLREQVQLFTAQSERHRLQLEVPERRLPVRGDANRLAQVVGNLLSNAIKYSPEGGDVKVVAEQLDGTVRVSVLDQGLGIPESLQSQVFTKFFRGDAAAGGIPGSGLGLAFSRAVIEAHGGRMSFSSAKGEGSTFWVDLPAAERA